MGPEYLYAFVTLKPKSSYSLRPNGKQLVLPSSAKTLPTLGDGAFTAAAAAAKMWNCFPYELRSITIDMFKRDLNIFF